MDSKQVTGVILIIVGLVITLAALAGYIYMTVKFKDEKYKKTNFEFAKKLEKWSLVTLVGIIVGIVLILIAIGVSK